MNALQMTWHTYSVFTFHMFVTMAMLYILIMFIPCLFISVFGFFVLHCAYIALCKLNDTKLLNCCTHTVQSVQCTLLHVTWGMEHLWKSNEIIHLFTDDHFFSPIEMILRNAFIEFINRGIQNKQFSVGKNASSVIFSPFLRIQFGVDDFCISFIICIPKTL